MDYRTIVLTGFMGTGKTSTGRALAALLNLEFVDMDETLEAREQSSIGEIFQAYGEAHFRARERDLVEELGKRKNLVIATGGGALLTSENRAAFAQAQVICLDAGVDEIMRRLNGAVDRPLLAGDKRAEIERLLAQRQDAYAQISTHVNTDGKTPVAVAHEIVDMLNADHLMHLPATLQVRTPDSAYPIYLGSGQLDRIGEILTSFASAKSCALVTNPVIGDLYATRVSSTLQAAGMQVSVIEIPEGEQYKTLGTVRELYDRFIEAKLERRSPILALGGGVLGDLTGFAAATYLRGVPFVQIPTTLLAMVDASIGGKVAVDHPAGKNLIGAYKFPHAVISDPAVLDSLPIEEYRAGMAEVCKHSIIGDKGLFEQLLRRKGPARLDAEMLRRAIRVKIEIVERDPFEENIRAHLNLGHTFAHALETLANFRMRHGYAVATGIAIAARLSTRIGWSDAATRDDIISLLQLNELPTRVTREFAPEQILSAMGADKKIRDGKLRLILLRAIGHVEIAENVTRDQILAAIQESIDS